MISVQIKTNTTRKTRNVDVNSTPASVFEDLEINPAGAMVNLNGSILSTTEMKTSFANLGVEDGSIVNLNSIIKADGASR
jgi:sulfur carrier protein ThiS